MVQSPYFVDIDSRRPVTVYLAARGSGMIMVTDQSKLRFASRLHESINTSLLLFGRGYAGCVRSVGDGWKEEVREVRRTVHETRCLRPVPDLPRS